MKSRIYRSVTGFLILLVALISLECSSAEFTSGQFYIQDQQWEKASESLRKEITNNPRNAEAWYYLGIASKQLGQYDSAVSQFYHAVQIDSTWKLKVKQELYELPGTASLVSQHDFRDEFRSAIETSNYIAADRVRLAWLDYLESFPPKSLTRTEQRDAECLRSLVGLVDSTAIRLRIQVFSSLKSGKYDEALSSRARLRDHLKSEYGTTNADYQADYLLQHRLSEAERDELRFVHMFVAE